MHRAFAKAFVVVVCLLGGSIGCGDPPPDTGRVEGGLTSGQVTFTVPASLGPTGVAVQASSRLELADRAKVVSKSGVGAPVANSGTDLVTIGNDASVGEIWTAGSVMLRGRLFLRTANVQHDVHAAGTVTLRSNASVGGAIHAPEPLVTTSVSRTYEIPPATRGNVTLLPGQSATLAPGRYGTVTAWPSSTLTIPAGVYAIDRLKLEPHARVIYENAEQPVVLVVGTDLGWKGDVQERATADLAGNVLVSYLGTRTAVLASQFIGTLVAPSARVELGTLANGVQHRGAFFARDLYLAHDAQVVHQPFPSTLIRGVAIDDATICPGDTVRATIDLDPDAADAMTTINGMTGPDRYVQFTGTPGPRHITVVASVDGIVQVRTIEVTVEDCGATPPATVQIRTSATPDGKAGLFVLNAAELTGAGREFAWDFGDGDVVTTPYPYVEHDYEHLLGPTEESRSFTVTLTVQRTGLPNVVGHETVTAHNLYATLRAQGTQRPPVAGDQQVTFTAGATASATITLRNPEAAPLAFDQRRLDRRYCDATRDPETYATDAIGLVIAPGATASYSVSVPAGDLGSDVCGLDVYLTGPTMGGLTPRASAYLTVRLDPARRRLITDAATVAMLESVTAQGLTADADTVTDGDLERLFHQGRIAQLPRTSFASAVLAGGTDLLGQECEPGEVIEPWDGVACLSTGEWAESEPGIANGLKGDLLLVMGCGSVGRMLRVLDTPQRYSHEAIMATNYFSLHHTTRSMDQLTKWLADNSGLGIDGLPEDLLKFGWPGDEPDKTIADAFNGYSVTDSSGDTFRLEDFAAGARICKGDTELTVPLVVKPHPNIADPVANRQLLRAAADATRGRNSHYRFYAFSEGKIALDPAFDHDGSSAAVSSVYLWSGLKSAGVTLEGELDADDLAAGVKEPPVDVDDGLYFYSAEERLAGLTVLHNEVEDEAYAGAGWLGEALTDISDDLSSQITNCFAHDRCSNRDGNDDDYWRYVVECREGCDVICGFVDTGTPDSPQSTYVCHTAPTGTALAPGEDRDAVLPPGFGRTVSPEQFLRWDAPPYGSAEKLEYRGVRKRIYRWQPSEGSGTLAVTVRDAGGVIVGARVIVQGTEFYTAAGGVVNIPVAAGLHDVLAQCGRPAVGQQPSAVGCDGHTTEFLEAIAEDVTVTTGTTTPVTLTLILPEEHRRVAIDGSIHITDGENVLDNEHKRFFVHEECFVGPGNTTYTIPTFHECAGDEVTAVVFLSCTLDATVPRRVNVHVKIELRESDSCGTNEELEVTGEQTITVDQGGRSWGWQHLDHADTVDDHIHSWLWVQNLTAGVDEPASGYCVPPGKGTFTDDPTCPLDFSTCDAYDAPPPSALPICPS